MHFECTVEDIDDEEAAAAAASSRYLAIEKIYQKVNWRAARA